MLDYNALGRWRSRMFGPECKRSHNHAISYIIASVLEENQWTDEVNAWHIFYDPYLLIRPKGMPIQRPYTLGHHLYRNDTQVRHGGTIGDFKTLSSICHSFAYCSLNTLTTLSLPGVSKIRKLHQIITYWYHDSNVQTDVCTNRPLVYDLRETIIHRKRLLVRSYRPVYNLQWCCDL